MELGGTRVVQTGFNDNPGMVESSRAPLALYQLTRTTDPFAPSASPNQPRKKLEPRE